MTQMQNTNVPNLRFPGFHGTWTHRNLCAFCDIISGYPVPGDKILEEQTDTPLLRGVNITEGRIRHSKDIDRFFGGRAEGLERFFIETGDVVLGMDGSKVGKNVAVVGPKDRGSLLIQRVARMRSSGDNVLDFAYHLIFSGKFHRYVDRINTSSGIPHISLKQIRDFSIPSPEPSEQRKIANFLRALDTKITQLSEKTRLLEDYKKGCMQQLFSQKIRFKDEGKNDFPDWEQKRLGDVATFSKGKGISKADISETGENLCIRYGELYTEYNEHIVRIVSRTDTPLKGAVLSKKNDVLMPTSDVTPNGLATASALDIEGIVLGGDILIVRSKVLLNRFFAYFIAANKSMLMRLVSGVTVYHIYGSDLATLRVKIPHHEEQRKIADFLSTLDRKIALVAEEHRQAQTFKKGLLQQMFI